jgi:hypothetical protein
MKMPEEEGFTQRRAIWVPKEIDAALSGKAGFLDFVDPRFAAALQKYIAGLHVTGTLYGDPQKRLPDFERLLKVDEVWVMCFRSPKTNQWRLMGRFIAPNEFVGFRLYRRSYLDGDPKYCDTAERFIRHWQEVAPDVKVLVGNTIQHYINPPVQDPYVPII